jgi:hypothetical protein
MEQPGHQLPSQQKGWWNICGAEWGFARVAWQIYVRGLRNNRQWAKSVYRAVLCALLVGCAPSHGVGGFVRFIQTACAVKLWRKELHHPCRCAYCRDLQIRCGWFGGVNFAFLADSASPAGFALFSRCGCHPQLRSERRLPAIRFYL